MSKLDKKTITDYFRSNLFEAISAYNAWKMIAYSKSNGVVSNEMAERYVKVQNFHPDFFVLAERAFLLDFVLMSLHSFDKRDDSFSLYKVDQTETENFVKDNKKNITDLRNARNKIFAHKDMSSNSSDYKIPPIIELDKFFKNLVDFYNKLTKGVDASLTMFDNAENMKRSVESLFMNLYRGEAMRKKEIDIEWTWNQNNKKASDVL